jgi:hypothetical protein
MCGPEEHPLISRSKFFTAFFCKKPSLEITKEAIAIFIRLYGGPTNKTTTQQSNETTSRHICARRTVQRSACK